MMCVNGISVLASSDIDHPVSSLGTNMSISLGVVGSREYEFERTTRYALCS